MLRRKKPLQRVQVSLRLHPSRHLLDAVVRSTEQIHASKSEYYNFVFLNIELKIMSSNQAYFFNVRWQLRLNRTCFICSCDVKKANKWQAVNQIFQHFECNIPNPPRVFEMVIMPDLEYPIVCVNVRRGFDGQSIKLELINLNSSASWYLLLQPSIDAKLVVEIETI